MVILCVNGATHYNGNTNERWVHGSGATLIVNGKLIGSVEEERFTRIKYDGNYPENSINALLLKANLTSEDVDHVTFVSDVKAQVYHFRDINETTTFFKSRFINCKFKILDHHVAHAFSTIYSSDFDEGNFFTLDGAGSNHEIVSGSFIPNYGSFGSFNKKDLVFTKHSNLYKDFHNENVLSSFYTMMSICILQKMTMTRGEYDNNLFDYQKVRESAPGKIMGLSAYGDYTKINIDPEFMFYIGSYSKYDFPSIYNRHEKLRPIIQPIIEQHEPEDLASWIQHVFETTVLNYLKKIPSHLLRPKLCFSGGCALNINLNTKILELGLFDDVHVSPAPNDDGLHYGGAMETATELGIDVEVPTNKGCIGLEYDNVYIKNIKGTRDGKMFDFFDSIKVQGWHCLEKSYDEVYNIVADLLVDNHIVAWFQGRSEFGPRALGNRSLLANPCFENKDKLNLKVKKREFWRPFAAMVMEEHLHNWFSFPTNSSPYMLFASKVLDNVKEKIPSVVHKDGSCRIQTVNEELNEHAYNLLSKFYEKTGVPVLLNTSFNAIPNEPIVETPVDALTTFGYCDMDILVINNYIIMKEESYETYIRKNKQVNADAGAGR